MTHESREWLNADPTQSAWVITHAESQRDHVNASVRVADCSRQVNIDFDVWQKTSVRDRLKKLQKLQHALAEFEKAYRAALIEAGLLKRGRNG